MSLQYFVCDSMTGRILRTGVAPNHEAVLAQESPGKRAFVYEGTDPVDDYRHWFNWNTMEVQDKLPMPVELDTIIVLADGTDVAMLSELPNPSEVRVSGPIWAKQIVTDGELELTFDAPGTYSIKVKAFPYLDWSEQIVATEP